MKPSVLLVLSAVASLALVAAQAPLRVCLPLGLGVPFADNPTGSVYEGFDVDIMRKLGGYLGREVDFEEHVFDGIWLLPNEGVCDVSAAAITIRDSRIEEGAQFSYPYIDADIVLLTQVGTPDTLETLCPGGRIGATAGSTYEDVARELALPLGCTILTFATGAEVDMALETGIIDAYPQDSPQAQFKVAENDALVIGPNALRTGDQYGYATSKAFLETLNDFLCAIRAPENTFYSDVFQEYFGDAPEPAVPAECGMRARIRAAAIWRPTIIAPSVPAAETEMESSDFNRGYEAGLQEALNRISAPSTPNEVKNSRYQQPRRQRRQGRKAYAPSSSEPKASSAGSANGRYQPRRQAYQQREETHRASISTAPRYTNWHPATVNNDREMRHSRRPH